MKTKERLFYGAGKQRMPINHHWLYKSTFDQSDLTDVANESDFEKIRLPHTNIELPYNYFDETLYQFVSCYKVKLPTFTATDEEDISVHFEGVMAYAEVYLNGTFLAEHYGGYTPFDVNLPKDLLNKSSSTQYDHDNWLIIKVDSTEREDIPPFGYVVDYLTYGGIYREVQLQIVHHKHFENVKLETPLVNGQQFTLNATFDLTQSVLPTDEVVLELWDDKTCIKRDNQSGLIQVDNHLSLDKLDEVIPWTIDKPKLYTVKLILKSDEQQYSFYECKIGFRVLAFKSDGFYLNGEKIKLRGLNRHQSFPYVGYAMPKSAQYADADHLKFELGVNVVRSSHYPPSRHFLDRCDEIGLLVIEELPGWQHIGDRVWQQRAIDSLDEMILRDWNHPSVILWGTRINESMDNTEFYTQSNDLAKKRDRTRATGGVRNFAGSEVLEDVYTYNDFVHRGNNSPLEAPHKIAKKIMPYLVTEHNGHMYPTKCFDSESRKIEHALRHARVINAAYRDNGISGAIGWCMFDYNTHKDFGSGDKICYHGVLDMFRNPKYAAGVYASQQSDRPYLSVASNFAVGDYDASELGQIVVFTNCDCIKIFRNDLYIGTFYPDQGNFSTMPHPPIIVDDLIGNLLYENEQFSEKDATIIKRILLHFLKFGGKLPLIDKIQMGILFVKYKMKFSDAANLYGKYIAGWGEKTKNYRFDGLIGEQVVAQVIKSAPDAFLLKAQADCYELLEAETYDVTRVTVSLVDLYDEVLSYANHVINCKVSGPIEIIGPNVFSLLGGSRAFWIKTTGEKGLATVTLSTDNGLQTTLHFNIL